jgi:HdeA/HdeB family
MPWKATTILLASLLCAANGALAQKIDLANTTCKQFTLLPKDAKWTVINWLGGYFTDDEDPTLVDIDKLKGQAERLLSFCMQNPNANLLAAAEDVLVN